MDGLHALVLCWGGGGRANAGMKCGGCWDEIRISDTVLDTAEMLQFGTTLANGDTILHLPLDSDFLSIVNPDLNAGYDNAAANRAALMAAGNLAFLPLGNTYITERGNKAAVIRDRDCGILQITNSLSHLSLGDYHLDACDTSMTIEFFMKATKEDVPLWGKFLSLETEDGSTGHRVLRVSRNDGDGLYCIMDNPTESSGSLTTSGIDAFDGKWHHVAVVISPGTWDNRPTENTQLWVDHVKPSKAYKSQMGTLMPDKGLVLRFGGSSTLSIMIDEIRITKGALPQSKFMAMRGRGAYIMFR